MQAQMGNVGAGGFLALNPMEPPHLIQDLKQQQSLNSR